MSFAAGPLVVDEGASRLTVPYGLFTVLTPRPQPAEGADRWMNGVLWEPLTCAAASGLGFDCDADAAAGFPKGFPESAGVADAEAFAVYGSFVCSPVGHDVAWAQERATMQLLAREEAAAENAFWTGSLDNTPVIADGATDLTSGGAVDMVEGIGVLEDWLAREYGSQGVLHMTRGGGTTAVGGLVAMGSGARLVSAMGTPIVAGSGYPGTSPDGAAPDAGETWVYATPALFGYRSDIFAPTNVPGDLLDRGVNNLHGVVERSYLIGFDPCGTAAVNVSLGCC